MKCDSCSVDIPPAWSNVIAKNVCPNCENPIMADTTIELMAGLKSALEQMPNDPQGIAGWLLSNYRMQKVGTGEPTGFYGVKNQKTNSNINENNLKVNENNPLQKFMKNVGVNLENHSKAKELVAQINGIKSIEEENDFSDLDGNGDSEDYVAESEDPEYTRQALKSMMNPALSKKMKKNNEPNFDDQGLEDLPHPSLAEDRIKRLEKQKDLAYGGSVGKIKRS